MALENTYGNDKTNLVNHFQEIKQQFSFKMGIDRFKAIRHCFAPNKEEILNICQILNENFLSQIEQVHIATIDESVIAYHPSRKIKEEAEARGEPIPVVFIPRKPHPNGLENFLLTTNVFNPLNPSKSLYFTLSIFPHLHSHDVASEALKFLINSWPSSHALPHVIGDAAFGTLENINLITQKNGLVTFSITPNFMDWFWDVLSYSVPPSHWRAAVNQNGLIGSIHSINPKDEGNSKKDHYQRILTTGFSTQTNSQATSQQPSNQATHQQQNKIPIYEKEELRHLNVGKLREICRKYSIKAGRTKELTIGNIIKRSQTINKSQSLVNTLFTSIKSHYKNDPAPIHSFYRAHFNYIDSIDRRWNRVEEHHPNYVWQNKMILTILRFSVMNSWTHHSQMVPQKWRTWRDALISELINNNNNNNNNE